MDLIEQSSKKYLAVYMKPNTYAFIRPTTYVTVVTNILLRTRNQIIIPPTCPPHTVDIIIHTYYRENKSGATFIAAAKNYIHTLPVS